METSRRDFIKKVGVTGLTAMGLPEILSANDATQHPEDIDPNKGLTILFQGDSITDGNRTRNNDWNHVMGHGYAYLIASRLGYDYPEKNLMFYNRGISGNRVRDLYARWQQDTIDLKPDVLSILIGVNDVFATVKNNDPESLEKFEETYKKILDKTRDTLPNTQLVLCEPFILPGGRVDEKTEIWQTDVPKMQQITKRLAEQYQAIFIELQEPFTKACQKAAANYWIWDGIHPMPAGHELMARNWIKEVRKKLTFIKDNP